MKFINTFFNKKSYHEDHAKVTGIGKVLLASFIAILIYIVISLVLYIKLFGMVGPVDLYTAHINKIVKAYPSNLIITNKDGHISKNISGAINIGSVPKYENDKNPKSKIDNKDLKSKVDSIDYWIQIDDSKSASLENYNNARVAVFVGHDGVVSYKDSGVQIIPANKIPDYEVNQNTLSTLSDRLGDYIPMIIIISLICIMIFGTLGIFIFNLLWNLFLALMVKASNIIKVDVSYNEALKFTNYASVPAIIITSFINFMFLYTAIVFATIWYIFKKK